MRKVVASVYVTLDGIMSPIDFTWRFAHPEHGIYARQVIFEADALLMGRATYEIFANFWPTKSAADDQPGEEGYVDRINSLPKYVASTTLQEPLAWNSTLLKGDISEAVAKLKAQPGQNILMYGAGPVARTLMQHGLLDEVQAWIYPVVAGKGERIFNGESDLTYMRLVKSKPFASGVVVHTYAPEKSA